MKKSDSIVEVSKALVNAQTELRNMKRSKTNPFFNSKYAPLEEIIDHVKPILLKHGLCILQSLCNEGELIGVSTMLLHTSGQYIENTMYLNPVKNNPQGAGAAITYGRRYALSAFLNISSEDDNDGNENNQKHETKQSMQATIDKAKVNKAPNEIEVIRHEINEMMHGYDAEERIAAITELKKCKTIQDYTSEKERIEKKHLIQDTLF